MPKGYPQKHMYKHPKIDPVRFQIEIDNDVYKGGREKYHEVNEQHNLLVYQDQKLEVPLPTQEQNKTSTNWTFKSKRKKRSNSFTLETLRFRDPGELMTQGQEIEDEQPRKIQRVDEI
jgi:hypothetical protein